MDKLVSLHWAIKNVKNEEAKELINELGIEVVYNGGTPLYYAILSGNKEIFDYLVDRNADINSVYTGGMSNLMAAAYMGDKYMVAALLNKGADINHQDKYGNKALNKAVKNPKYDLDVIKLLLDHGADPFEKNNSRSVMDYAVDMSGDDELVALFEQYKK